jgi:hypothetical protein
MMKLLVGWDLNPLVRNLDGKTVLEVADRRHKALYDFIDRVSKRGEPGLRTHKKKENKTRDVVSHFRTQTI